jgi:hypothetical protein
MCTIGYNLLIFKTLHSTHCSTHRELSKNIQRIKIIIIFVNVLTSRKVNTTTKDCL